MLTRQPVRNTEVGRWQFLFRSCLLNLVKVKTHETANFAKRNLLRLHQIEGGTSNTRKQRDPLNQVPYQLNHVWSDCSESCFRNRGISWLEPLLKFLRDLIDRTSLQNGDEVQNASSRLGESQKTLERGTQLPGYFIATFVNRHGKWRWEF